MVFSFFSPGPAEPRQASKTLKAAFFYANENIPDELAGKCPPRLDMGVELAPVPVVAGLVTDIAVNLIGKAAESLIDAAAARTQFEATTLDATLPIDGFFTEKGTIAVSGGCLIFHNGVNESAKDASIFMSLLLTPSFDGTAFRFHVFRWSFNQFLNPRPSNFLQNFKLRDFALKIEFLTPGSAGLGTRAVFVEHVFQSVNEDAISNAFMPKQHLPWVLSPPKPTIPADAPPGKYSPLNIRITVVETTRPNQFALWVQDIAKEKKADIANSVRDNARRLIDPSFAITERMKLNDAAAIAFNGYKVAWDGAIAFRAQQPNLPGVGADQTVKDKYNAELLAWKSQLNVKIWDVSAKRILARSAFDMADLGWPGDLPAVRPE